MTDFYTKKLHKLELNLEQIDTIIEVLNFSMELEQAKEEGRQEDFINSSSYSITSKKISIASKVKEYLVNSSIKIKIDRIEAE